MRVIKRDGRTEAVQFDKVLERIDRLRDEFKLEEVDSAVLAKKVIAGIYDGVTTQTLDTLAAETAADKTIDHPDYSKLAAAIEVSSLHKETLDSFSETAAQLAAYVHPITKKSAPLLADDVAAIIEDHAAELDAAVDCARDYYLEYFGFMTLASKYLLRMNGRIAERPQWASTGTT